MCLTSNQHSVSHALVVPKPLRDKVLIAAHEGLGHGGLNTIRSLVHKYFTWLNLVSDIRRHVQSCDKCTRFNKSGAPKVPMLEPEIISERGEKLALDIVGHLPTSKHKYRFILTLLEPASGFAFTIPLKSYTSEDTSKAILSNFYFGSTPCHSHRSRFQFHVSHSFTPQKVFQHLIHPYITLPSTVQWTP